MTKATILVIDDIKTIEVFKNKNEQEVEEYVWENLLYPEKVKIISSNDNIAEIRKKYIGYNVTENRIK